MTSVEWRDLLQLNKIEVIHELVLSVPWLLASWFFAFHEQYLIALGCSCMFFLTGLRQVHNAFHYALGVGRNGTEFVMFILSIFMLGSMHAIKINHLRHHRFCMTEQDIEAMSARLPWWKAILVGPIFPVRLHLNAIKVATYHERMWIYAELLANVFVICVVFIFLDFEWLKYHVIAMLIGQCLTAFFAVWTVHHDCETNQFQARTVRGKLKSFLTYSMFFHVEHHLFPAVPTCKLKVLAERLDIFLPGVEFKKSFSLRTHKAVAYLMTHDSSARQKALMGSLRLSRLVTRGH